MRPRPRAGQKANGCGITCLLEPTGLAVGFGLEGCPTGRRPCGRRPIHPFRDAEGWFPRPPEAPPRTFGRFGCGHMMCPRAPSPRRLQRVCDFMNIVRLKPPSVNSLPVNQCDFVRWDPVDLRKPEHICHFPVPPPARSLSGIPGAAIVHRLRITLRRTAAPADPPGSTCHRGGGGGGCSRRGAR